MTACSNLEQVFHFPAGRHQCLLAGLPALLLLPTLWLPAWWPFWPVSAGLGLALLWWAFRQLATSGAACQRRIVALELTVTGMFRIHLANGLVLPAVLLPGGVVHPHLLAIRFRVDDGGLYRLIQPVRGDLARQLSALRLRLLRPGPPPGEQPSPSA